MDAHRASRRPREPASRGALTRATLYFDLASPYTYLAAERAERLFAGLEWQPAFTGMLHGSELGDEARAAAAARAELLGGDSRQDPLQFHESPRTGREVAH
ncbi:hypothetical protein, partial [Aromatoleum sp.]|uniref:hypothetical protein n=1 Tax=Aromatoleum sp. TaxID=2307007 RepID=UPI002FC829A0